ncbi:GH15462 [Drosophila grimshawi]|uniref:GH15462 n=1 Tax=Drosophila grimshawi TaxID=7222 RepID=B4J2C9_DROGR|nr:GH15462 [Drosophila grimshawi]
MKFILILACLALFVAHIHAQRCRGRLAPNRKACTGGRNEGIGRGRNCARNANRNMWWYDTTDSTCKRMNYRGCGGNNNRYCTRAECERRCRRRATTTAAPTTAAPTTADPTTDVPTTAAPITAAPVTAAPTTAAPTAAPPA